MQSMIRWSSIAALFFLLVPLVHAGDDPSPVSGFQADFLGQLDYAQKQILSLEEAMPQEKFTWRPSEGVRSVSEVYMHIAFSNYLLLSFMGFEPPAGVELTGDIMADAKKWEATTTDKAKIAELIKKSMDNVRAMVPKVGDLEKKIDFFGQSITTRNMMINVLTHLHEHLGQSIAYARMNGVVPPWSAKP
jgi:uncharacterized damage-inducible protein DinB